MGQTYSFVDAEKKTWTEHTLMYDAGVRKSGLEMLRNFKDGEDIILSYLPSCWGNISFQHWFVTNDSGSHFLEFGGAELDIYLARVEINTHRRKPYPVVLRKAMDDTIRQRMQQVIGVSNYSLCLRNCEHIANFVVRGAWTSKQMAEDVNKNGPLLDIFKSILVSEKAHLLSNQFPASIQPYIFKSEAETVYPFIKNNLRATQFSYYLDWKQDTYNILVVGPTGSGKSRVINVLFNQEICHSETSHHSVTKDCYFIRGEGKVFNGATKQIEHREIVVADTIGLCDTEWKDTDIENMIRNRVDSSWRKLDAVMVVYKADRLDKHHVASIKRVLKWLKYHEGDNDLRFLFVGTHGDHLSDLEKERLRKEAIAMFGLRDTKREKLTSRGEQFYKVGSFDSLVYTGFPPNSSIEGPRSREQVENSWKWLRYVILLPGDAPRLDISDARSRCTIL